MQKSYQWKFPKPSARFYTIKKRREYRLVRPKFVWGTGLLSHLKLAALSTQPQSVEKGASYLRLIHILKDWTRIVFPCQVFVLFDFIDTLLVDLLHSISKTFIVFAFSQPPIPNFSHIITINIVKLYRHNKVSTAKLKNSIIYFIIIYLFVFRRCRRGSNPQFQPYH